VLRLDGRQDKKLARTVFTVRYIDCATCALAIEKHVKKVNGVKDVRTAVMLNRILIDYDESEADTSEIKKAIGKAGYSNYLVRRDEK
jgi:Cu+-exporting ATPase